KTGCDSLIGYAALCLKSKFSRIWIRLAKAESADERGLLKPTLQSFKGSDDIFKEGVSQGFLRPFTQADASRRGWGSRLSQCALTLTQTLLRGGEARFICKRLLVSLDCFFVSANDGQVSAAVVHHPDVNRNHLDLDHIIGFKLQRAVPEPSGHEPSVCEFNCFALRRHLKDK